MATERLSNLGYFGLIKEATPGTPLTPTDFVPVYSETLTTDGNLQDLDPAFGNKFKTYLTVAGQRSHKGDVTVLFEPNTAARLFDMLITKGSSTGTNPTTHPFTLSTTTPASYTVEVSLGNIVKRVWGVQSDSIDMSANTNEIQAKVSITGLGSFDAREITSQSGSGPYTITLADPNGVYDGNPTKGLVVGDLIRFYKFSTGATIDATVASVVNGTQFTTATNPTGIAAGDAVHLRPATPIFNNLQPFLWSKTKFQFGATAAAALSATHTPVESGSTWTVTHSFKSDKGELRSGSHDPASLARTTGDIDLTIKKITDTPEDTIAFKNLNKSACVVRHFSGPTNQYELRITYNQLVTDEPLGQLKSGDLVYSTLKYHTNYNQTDGQAFDVKVLNALSSI